MGVQFPAKTVLAKLGGMYQACAVPSPPLVGKLDDNAKRVLLDCDSDIFWFMLTVACSETASISMCEATVDDQERACHKCMILQHCKFLKKVSVVLAGEDDQTQ